MHQCPQCLYAKTTKGAKWSIEETKVRCNDRSSSRSIVGARNRRNDFEKLSFYFYMKALSRSLTPSQSIEFCTLRFLLRCEKSRKVQPLWFFQRFIPWRIHAWKALVATHLTNCQIVLSKECSSWKLAYYLLGHDNDRSHPSTPASSYAVTYLLLLLSISSICFSKSCLLFHDSRVSR